jgi:hypothetical protein
VWPWENEGDMALAYSARNNLVPLLDEIERLKAEKASQKCKQPRWCAACFFLGFVIMGLLFYLYASR